MDTCATRIQNRAPPTVFNCLSNSVHSIQPTIIIVIVVGMRTITTYQPENSNGQNKSATVYTITMDTSKHKLNMHIQ